MKLLLNAINTEWENILRLHPRALATLILMPLIYVLLFGELFYYNTVTKVPIAVCDLDHSYHSRQLIQMLSESNNLNIALTTENSTEAENTLLTNQVYGAVIIPSNFAKEIVNEQPVNVELIVNNANTVLGGTITSGVQSIVMTYSSQLAVENRLKHGWDSAGAQSANAVSLSPRVLYNSTGGYVDFFLSLLILHSMQIGIVFFLAPTLSLERKFCPIPKQELCNRLSAKLIIYTFITTILTIVLTMISQLLFGLNNNGSYGQLIVLSFFFCLALNAFAIMVGSLVDTPVKCISYPLFYIMPSILFTGGLWPRSSMDMFSLLFSYIIPIGYSADSFRDILQRRASPHLFTNSAVLIFMTVIFFILALYGRKYYQRGVSYVKAHV